MNRTSSISFDETRVTRMIEMSGCQWVTIHRDRTTHARGLLTTQRNLSEAIEGEATAQRNSQRNPPEAIEGGATTEGEATETIPDLVDLY